MAESGAKRKDNAMSTNFDVNRIREDFPIFKNHPDLIYLDNSATSQKPFQVIRAVTEFYEKSNANPLRGLYDLAQTATEEYEQTREKVQKFINAARADEIIFTRNATESLNLAAYSFGNLVLHEGDEIVVSIAEHHSNLLPWQAAAARHGAVLRYLECDEKGKITEEAFREALTKRTKLVAITQVSNVLGRKNDIKAFAKICHEKGIVIVVDGAQSVPHMIVDVQDLDVDFLAFSGHKMLAPMGIGVLYGKHKYLKKMQPFLSGGEMIESVTRERTVFAQPPQRFEAGTVNAGGVVGLGAAIDYINAIGFEQIEKQESMLTQLAAERLQKIPHVHLIGSDDPAEHHGILTFSIDGVHPHDIAAILDADHIAVRAGHHCAQPLHQHLGVMSTTRASLGFYNTEEEIVKFTDSVAQIRRKMGYDE